MGGYYQYKKEIFKCKNCGWSGEGSKTELGESFEELFEIHCPNCHKEIGIIDYPTTKEVLKYGTEEDKKRVASRETFLKKLEASQLQTANQLPEINDEVIAFVLKEINEDGEDYIIVTHYEKIIWKEIRAYEYYERFIELGKLLKEKYGDKMVDLVPDVTGLYLWGDKLSASEQIDKFRKGLRFPRKTKL